MDTYYLGMILLVALFSVAPTLRRLAHRKMIGGLRVEGATVPPRLWRASLLQYRRARWDAEVRFMPPGELFAGGHHGLLRFSGRLRRATPSVELGPGPGSGATRFEQIYSVGGDAAFAAQLFVPELRDVLVRLEGLGVRLTSVRDGTVDAAGPQGKDLRQVLGTCELMMDLMASAVSGLPEKV